MHRLYTPTPLFFNYFLPTEPSQFTGKVRFFSVLFPERRAQIQCREEFCVSEHRENFIDAKSWVCIFYRYCDQLVEIATQSRLSTFLLSHGHFTAQWDFDGQSCFSLHASVLCGVILLAPSL